MKLDASKQENKKAKANTKTNTRANGPLLITTLPVENGAGAGKRGGAILLVGPFCARDWAVGCLTGKCRRGINRRVREGGREGQTDGKNDGKKDGQTDGQICACQSDNRRMRGASPCELLCQVADCCVRNWARNGRLRNRKWYCDVSRRRKERQADRQTDRRKERL